MKKRKKYQKKVNKEVIPVVLEPYQVTSIECGGDFKKMFKKFSKKCRNDEILRPVFDKLSYKSPSQARREKHKRAIFRIKKEELNKQLEEKNDEK